MLCAQLTLDINEAEPSWVILGTLCSIVLLTVVLYFTGGLGFLVHVIGTLIQTTITRGFLVWRSLLAWARWPVFLAIVLGFLGMGLHLIDSAPAVSALIAVVPLVMGMAACLAYMYIDWE